MYAEGKTPPGVFHDAVVVSSGTHPKRDEGAAMTTRDLGADTRERKA
jgi:hypothetical protein